MGIHSSLTCFPRNGIFILFYSIFMLKAGTSLVFPGGSVVKNLSANAGKTGDSGFNPWVGKSSWNRKWQHTPVFLLGKPYRQRSLVGYSPWCHKESDMTKHEQARRYFICLDSNSKFCFTYGGRNLSLSSALFPLVCML